MAVNTLATISWVTKDIARGFLNEMKFIGAGNINRSYDDQYIQSGAKVGRTVNARLPQRFVATDGEALQVQALFDQTVPITLTNQKNVGMSWSSAEETTDLDDIRQRYTKPMGETLANSADVLAFQAVYRDIYSAVGTPGTTPSATLTYLQAGVKLTDLAAPLGGRRAMLDQLAMATIANTSTALFNPSERLAAELERERTEKQEMAIELARLKGAAEASAKPKVEPVQDLEPEYDALDPKPWIDWNNRQHKKELDGVRGELSTFKQTTAQIQAESAWQEINKNWQESDEVYANSYGFIKGKLEEIVKQKYPTANASQIKQLIKQEENIYVGQQASKGNDVKTAFKMLAIESGFNPFEKPLSDAPKPGVNKTVPNIAAIAEARKKSGSFIGTGASGAVAKKGSAKDIANATLDELMGFSKDDFRAAVKEAKELGERGERL